MDNLPTSSKEKILTCLRTELPGILAEQPVMLAYLYGSLAGGSASSASDVDIALVFKPCCPLSPYERMKRELHIAAEIEDRCSIREADVRSIDNAPLTVQGKVLTESLLLYSRDEEYRVQYEVYTRKLYFDFAPVEEMTRQAFFERLKQEGLTSGKARQG
ncbi:MAG: nucleotidyltransferase domain-containing protein [Deltaproteobacteria bacterium]|nr:MAG: nucleotidyltransferase domain-containing protein [Deltaproteobacteria bacterium]